MIEIIDTPAGAVLAWARGGTDRPEEPMDDERIPGPGHGLGAAR